MSEIPLQGSQEETTLVQSQEMRGVGSLIRQPTALSTLTFKRLITFAVVGVLLCVAQPQP